MSLDLSSELTTVLKGDECSFQSKAVHQIKVIAPFQLFVPVCSNS